MLNKHSACDEEVSITAGVAKLVDAVDLKSIGLIDRAGSSPAPGTTSFQPIQTFHLTFSCRSRTGSRTDYDHFVDHRKFMEFTYPE